MPAGNLTTTIIHLSFTGVISHTTGKHGKVKDNKFEHNFLTICRYLILKNQRIIL
jgi:hypothetical protein